jgi:serine/threonine protein kinase
LPDDQREGAIESACADDPALRDELRALIRADSEGSVLDFGLGEVARDVLERVDPGIRTIGPYRVIRELGRGGMGVVYLAERDDLRSRVAIKVLRDATLSPLRRARLRAGAAHARSARAPLHRADLRCRRTGRRDAVFRDGARGRGLDHGVLREARAPCSGPARGCFVKRARRCSMHTAAR